jgi:hypothetical protein
LTGYRRSPRLHAIAPTKSARRGTLNILAIQLVRAPVLRHARDFCDEILPISCSPKQMKAELHARRDPAGRDDSSGVDHARVTDAARGGNFRRTIDGHFSVTDGQTDPTGCMPT